MAENRVKRGLAADWQWVVAGAVLALALGIGAYLFFKEAVPLEVGPPSEAELPFTVTTGITGPTIDVNLYFPSASDGYLRAESRKVRQVADGLGQLRLVVDELIVGPHTGGLVPTFPEDARVKSMFVDYSGVAYVNFSRELQTGFPGGAWTETLTIFSLANTLAMNFDNINRVQILVEGQEIPTLAGHIDTTRPFGPREALVR